MSQQNSSTVNINNVDHDITITFDDSNQQIAHIGYTLINRISIFTNIFDPFFSGELEYIDEFALEKAANNKDANINATASYRYRGDGYDKLTITIHPHSNANNANVADFACSFSIVDSYHKFDNNTGRLVKVLILEDWMKHILSERQSYFTTCNKNIKYTAQCSNDQRSMTTGCALSSLLSQNFPGLQVKDSVWDNGGNEIFYSAGINEKAITTLENLYNLHFSSADNINDKCFLSHSAHSDNNWSLISLNDMFSNAINTQTSPKQAGNIYTQTIYLENTNDSNSTHNSKYNPTGSLINNQSGYVQSYDFKDLQHHDAVSLNSHVVYNYNISNKQFTIDVNDGNIDKFKEFFFANYISKLIGKNDKPYPNIPLTQIKQNNITTTNIFNLYDNSNISVSRNNLLLLTILLNNSIEVNLLGDIIREPGLFIGIDSTAPGSENDYNSKIYGQYLIISAAHNFIGNTYTNKLICSKPYLYNKPEDMKESEEIYG